MINEIIKTNFKFSLDNTIQSNKLIVVFIVEPKTKKYIYTKDKQNDLLQHK